MRMRRTCRPPWYWSITTFGCDSSNRLIPLSRNESETGTAHGGRAACGDHGGSRDRVRAPWSRRRDDRPDRRARRRLAAVRRAALRDEEGALPRCREPRVRAHRPGVPRLRGRGWPRAAPEQHGPCLRGAARGSRRARAPATALRSGLRPRDPSVCGDALRAAARVVRGALGSRARSAARVHRAGHALQCGGRARHPPDRLGRGLGAYAAGRGRDRSYGRGLATSSVLPSVVRAFIAASASRRRSRGNVCPEPSTASTSARAARVAPRLSSRLDLPREGAGMARCYRREVSVTTGANDQLLAGLNPSQREAVTLPDGPALVIAGAGSGKTRVLTSRIAYLLGEGRARPHEVMAITFTNRAAAEMRERVELLVGQSRGMWVMTFHAACGRILRREADRLGYRSNFTIYDQADQVRVVKACLEELGRDPKRFPPRGIHSRISSEKNRLVSAAMFRENIGNFFDQVVADVFELYERRLHASNAMDFDDLLVRSVDLLESFDDVRERWQGAFNHLLVDEYQDTNHAQYRIVPLLFSSHPYMEGVR